MNQPVTESNACVTDIAQKIDRLRKRSEFAAAIDLLEVSKCSVAMDDATSRIFARLYCELQRPDLAISTLSRDEFSGNPLVLADLAVYHELLGQFEAAEELINCCIDIEPDQIQAQLVLARVLEHQGEYERAYRIVANIFQQNQINDPKTAIRGLYQLAHCLDKLGNYTDAFGAACKAKEIQRRIPGAQQLSQQGMKTLQWAKQIHESMDRLRLDKWNESNEDGIIPNLVHLIGHPRSGTTLLGHRLEKFTDISVSSEQDIFLQHSLSSLIGSPSNVLSNLDALDLPQLTGIRKDYIRLLKPFCNTLGVDSIIIDKKPAHLTFLFALLRLTPNAKLIVALRDPRDVIVSCFMRYFPLSDMSASFLSLGTACMVYRAFMNNWFIAKKYLDDQRFCEVRYDQLCLEPENTLSHVGTFIGSQMSHQSEESQNQYIHSPTFADVRKPIQRSQIGRWQSYAKQLHPFLKVLDPIIEKLGYQ